MTGEVKWTPEQQARYEEILAMKVVSRPVVETRSRHEERASLRAGANVVKLSPTERMSAGIFDENTVDEVPGEKPRDSATVEEKLAGAVEKAKAAPALESAGRPLNRNKNAGGVPSLQNAVLAIQRLNVSCRYDVFHRRFLVEGESLLADGNLDDKVRTLRLAIDRTMEFDPGVENTMDALKVLCRQHSFDPVADYLDGLVWDGKPRIDHWLTAYMGAPDDELTRAFGRKMLVAGVRRVRQPGCKFDFIPVWEGEQGTGKSSALRILAVEDENFTDAEILNQSQQAQQELLRGKWIVELSELAGLRKAEAERVKSFASRTHDSARAAYARESEDVPRCCIIVGTTNDQEYLQDVTGNRRFWPITTGQVDLAALQADRDQLWAEAAAVEKGGEDLTIPKELWAAAGKVQTARLAKDPWEDLLTGQEEMWARMGFAVKTEEEWRVKSEVLLQRVLKHGPERVNTAVYRRLSAVMKKLGWSGPLKLRFGGGPPVQGYSRPRLRQPAPFSFVELLELPWAEIVRRLPDVERAGADLTY